MGYELSLGISFANVDRLGAENRNNGQTNRQTLRKIIYISIQDVLHFDDIKSKTYVSAKFK